MVNFLVLNRDRAKDYVTDQKHILISIYCHNDIPAELSKLSSRLDVLRLQFDDWNVAAKEKIELEYKNSVEAKKQIYFSKEHAKQIVDFVSKYIGEIDLIACQCDAGISRSAGVAAALSKCINEDDEYFFKHYLPNSLVYKTILEVWNKEA